MVLELLWAPDPLVEAGVFRAGPLWAGGGWREDPQPELPQDVLLTPPVVIKRRRRVSLSQRQLLIFWDDLLDNKLQLETQNQSRALSYAPRASLGGSLLTAPHVSMFCCHVSHRSRCLGTTAAQVEAQTHTHTLGVCVGRGGRILGSWCQTQSQMGRSKFSGKSCQGHPEKVTFPPVFPRVSAQHHASTLALAAALSLITVWRPPSPKRLNGIKAHP